MNDREVVSRVVRRKEDRNVSMKVSVSFYVHTEDEQEAIDNVFDKLSDTPDNLIFGWELLGVVESDLEDE